MTRCNKMLVHEYLQRSAKSNPDKTSLVIDQTRYTYRDLIGTSHWIAARLSEMGVERHDRVIIHGEFGLGTVASIFSCSMLGAAFVVLNPELRSDRLDYIIKDCDPKAAVIDTDKIDNYTRLENLLPLEGIKEGDEIASPKIIDMDLASIIYTSGSTGSPKGVMLSQKNIDVASDSIIEYLENVESDIILSVLPLSFDYGLYQLLMCVKICGTLILERNFSYPSKLLEIIEKEKVTGLPIVPTIGNLIVRLSKPGAYDLNSVRYISNTAQAMNERIIKGLSQRFPATKIYSMYGLTECKRVSYLDPMKINEKPNSVGKPMSCCEVYLIDVNGDRIDDPGMEGQLVVRGPNVMIGYWNSPQETADRLIPGKYPGQFDLLTGDSFYKDEDGDLYFVTRMDEIIKTSGERVNPLEVEDFLNRIEGVNESVVIPVKDAILGNALKAVISCEMEISIDDIRRKCTEDLEKFMVPKHFYLIDEVPKNPNGKIDRKRIKTELAVPGSQDARNQN